MYTWNTENKLVKFERYYGAGAIKPMTTATYTYDALGRRIEKRGMPSPLAGGGEGVITGYVYDGMAKQ